MQQFAGWNTAAVTAQNVTTLYTFFCNHFFQIAIQNFSSGVKKIAQKQKMNIGESAQP